MAIIFTLTFIARFVISADVPTGFRSPLRSLGSLSHILLNNRFHYEVEPELASVIYCVRSHVVEHLEVLVQRRKLEVIDLICAQVADGTTREPDTAIRPACCQQCHGTTYTRLPKTYNFPFSGKKTGYSFSPTVLGSSFPNSEKMIPPDG